VATPPFLHLQRLFVDGHFGGFAQVAGELRREHRVELRKPSTRIGKLTREAD